MPQIKASVCILTGMLTCRKKLCMTCAQCETLFFIASKFISDVLLIDINAGCHGGHYNIS